MHEDFNATPTPPDPESLKRGHECRDIGIRGLTWFIIIFIGVGAVIHVIVWYAYRNIAHTTARADPEPSPFAGSPTPPPSPILQPTQKFHEKVPSQDLQEMHAREDAHLNTYAWVDQNAGVVRIPIDRAMELVVGRGLPTSRPADTARQ